ncbi:MAG: DUF488 domain-containing protein [Planctomycetota bacterium]
MSIQTLFTIGYAGKDIKQFVNILLKAHITTLVDVRQLPLSRKHDFSKSNLREHLEHSGIEYKHFGVLGSPKTIRDKVRQDNDYETFFAEYAKYLKTQPEAVAEAADTATRQKSCLMCVEPEPAQCHRRIVAETIEKQYPRLNVVHL